MRRRNQYGYVLGVVIAIALMVLMAGCALPQPQVELRVPSALLAPCFEPQQELETNEDLVALYLSTRAALRECSGRLRAVDNEYGTDAVEKKQ